MTIEEMQAFLDEAIARGRAPAHWRIAPPVLHDLVRHAAGGAALIIAGDQVRIAGLPVIIGDTDVTDGVELVYDDDA